MKIGVVGAGQVGATAAYAMMMRGVGSEIVLVDINADLARRRRRARHPGGHALRASRPALSAGGAADLDGAQIVVLAAGASRGPGRPGLTSCRATPKSSADIDAGRYWRQRRIRSLSGGDQSSRRRNPDRGDGHR